MLKYYFTTAAFSAENPDRPEADPQRTKFFGSGILVIGTEDYIGTDRVVKSDDGYELPSASLREVQDPEAIKSLQNMQASVKKIMNRDIVGDIVKANKYSMIGSSAGSVAGILFGIISRKNIFWCGFIGTVAGGFAGYGFSKFKK